MTKRGWHMRALIAAGCVLALLVAGLALWKLPGILNRVVPLPSVSPVTADYVAIGDSYTAAPNLPRQVSVSTPSGCDQSDSNYPHLVARRLGVRSLTDMSCSGATTASVTEPQPTSAGTNAAQGDALSGRTKLVTVSLGGNDAAILALLFKCAGKIGVPSHCRRMYVSGSSDVLKQAVSRVTPLLDTMLATIRRKAPRARIFVVGYPQVLPPSGLGCPAEMLLTGSDMRYFDGGIRRLNAEMRTAARAHGDVFVDTYTPSQGRNVCSGRQVRWIESMRPVAPAVTMHPNARAQGGFARAVLAAIGGAH